MQVTTVTDQQQLMRRAPPREGSARAAAPTTTILLRAAALYAAFAFGALLRYAPSSSSSSSTTSDLRGRLVGGDEEFGGAFFPVRPRIARYEEGRGGAGAGGGGERRDDGEGAGVESGSDSDGDGGKGRRRRGADVRRREGTTWPEVRRGLFEEYEYCKFPGFVIEGKPKFYLGEGKTISTEWREREREAARYRDNELRKEFEKERRKRKKKRKLKDKDKGKGNEKDKRSRERLEELVAQAEKTKIDGGEGHEGQHAERDWSHLDREITYIHVGKAGGSSSSCNVREAFSTVRKHCGTKRFPADGPRESAISRQVNCYTHYNDNMHCYDVNKSFIINTRNPVHRISSWYLYEHVWNEPWNNPSRAETHPRCGVYMVSTCFDSWDQLVTEGLRGVPPPRDAKLRVGYDLTREECSRWAWASVRGDIPANYHNAWNYDWYAHRLFEDDGDEGESKEIFNLRVEHVDRDWRTIDRMVGGTGDPLPGADTPRNAAAAKDHLPVTDRDVSEEGLRNLCRALCDEIRVYKRLLFRAANLNEEDVRESVDGLRATCPAEADARDGDECEASGSDHRAAAQ